MSVDVEYCFRIWINGNRCTGKLSRQEKLDLSYQFLILDVIPIKLITRKARDSELVYKKR